MDEEEGPPMAAVFVERSSTPPMAARRDDVDLGDLVTVVQNTLASATNQAVARGLGAGDSASAEMVDLYGCFATDILNAVSHRGARLLVYPENERRLKRLNTALRKASKVLSSVCPRTRRRGMLGRARAAARGMMTRRAGTARRGGGARRARRR